MNFSDLTEVWTPLSVVLAALAGLVLGYFVIGRIASDPTYASGRAKPREYGVLTSGLTVAVGLVFYSVQIIAVYIYDDNELARVLGRFGLWVLYGVCIGVGVSVRLRRYYKTKRDEAHERAVAAIDKGN